MAEKLYNKITKEESILNYLKEGHELTCREAIDKFSVNYLPRLYSLISRKRL